MTFIVHHVSFTNDGREIIRSKDYDQSTLSVGRSPGSDIALTDVAVPLDHARITAEANGSLTITAIGGAPFTANGRSVTTISFGRGDGGELNFGSHEFNISQFYQYCAVAATNVLLFLCIQATQITRKNNGIFLSKWKFW